MVARAAFRPRQDRSHTREPDPKRCPPYLKWLRGRECFLSIHAPGRHQCAGFVRACHFDPWGDKGTGTKVSDMAAMPMCDGAHTEQGDVLGWPDFQSKYGFDGRDVVTAYWLQWLEETPMGRAWAKK